MHSLLNAMTRVGFPAITETDRGPPFLSLQGKGLSPAVDAGSFVPMAEVTFPMSWEFPRFYMMITYPHSGLDAFTSGHVQHISCYKDDISEYLLMRVDILKVGFPPIWVRTERFPTYALSPPHIAPDRVQFSADRSKLWNPGNDHIMTTALPPLNFRHIIDLLNTVHQAAIPPSLTILDPKWFASVVMGLLHVSFGQLWVNPPSSDWVDIVLNLFENDTSEAVQSVQRRFAVQHPNVKMISLMHVEAWQNEPTPLAQLPSSKQGDRESAYLKPADVNAADAKKNPPFTNPQAGPRETPNLTGRILRLGSTPMATGGYSSVWRGNLLSATSDDPDQALQVAIKVLRASYTDEDTVKRKLLKRLHVEMRIWAQLHHENVVRLLGHTEEPEGPGLVSIWYPHGNVLSFLAKNPNVNREVICADIALGLQYLHEHKPPIIHGDMKGPNVLVDGEGGASICDFGLSIILDGGPTGHTSSNFGGSLRFLAPELLDENTRTAQTDIYAYACTCIQILFDQEPYHQLSKEAPLMRAISNHQPPFEPSNEETTFPLFWQMLKRSWHHDRSSRPSLNLIAYALQRGLYRTYRTNLHVHQGIGRRVRFMCLPDIEQANLISVADSGLSIIVDSPTSLHRVPIYQRYHWELMDTQNLEVSEDFDASWSHEAESPHSFFIPPSSLSGKDAASSEGAPYVSKWKDYSARFRLPYSSMVSYEPYNEANDRIHARGRIGPRTFIRGAGRHRAPPKV